jgi:hypothetical protein
MEPKHGLLAADELIRSVIPIAALVFVLAASCIRMLPKAKGHAGTQGPVPRSIWILQLALITTVVLLYVQPIIAPFTLSPMCPRLDADWQFPGCRFPRLGD